MIDHATFTVRARAVIFHEGKLLIVKHRPDADYWALPGGHMEYGETILACLEREIIEELGVKPTVGRLLYVYTFEDKKNGTHPLEFYFEVTNGADFLDISNKERTHAFELADLGWVAPESAPRILPPVVGDDFKAGSLLSDTVRYTKG